MSFLLSLIVAVPVVIVATGGSTVQAGDACKRTHFETKLVEAACSAGGTAGAKDAMKKWVKEAKPKQAGLECATCHSKLAPSYDLKPDGLASFKRLGGV